MKRLGFIFCIFVLISALNYALAEVVKPKVKVLLLISEQDIEGNRFSWWADGAEFSVFETGLSRLLGDSNFSIIDVNTVNNLLKKDKSLKTAQLTDKESVLLARVLRADYIVKGMAVASIGSSIYSAAGQPFFATAAVKLIRVKDGQTAAALDGIGSSLNSDISTGGKDALSNLAADIAAKIISHITKEGGK